VIVRGTDNPAILKPVPATVAAEIVTLAVPEFVSVIVCVPLLPRTTLPKFTGDGLAARLPCVPVPDKAIVAGEPDALLVIVMLPEALPAVVGANFAEKLVFAPALIVAGAEIPLKLNAAPEALIAEIVKAALPGLDSVMVCDALPPTRTFPKGTLAGLIVSCGWAAVAVPVSAIASGEFGALLEIEMLPETLPAAAGANFAVKEAFCPALIVNGVDRPDMLKPVPETLAAEIVTLAVPPLARVIGTESLLPTRTLPKPTLAGVAASVP
jgi:hypothetical protein